MLEEGEDVATEVSDGGGSSDDGTVAVAAPSPGMTFCAQLLAKQETAQGGTSLTTLNLSLPTA